MTLSDEEFKAIVDAVDVALGAMYARMAYQEFRDDPAAQILRQLADILYDKQNS